MSPSNDPYTQPNQPEIRRFAMAGLGLLILYGVGFVIGGEFGSFMEASYESVPFAVLAVLAYIGIRQTGGRIAAVLWLFGLVGAVAVLALANSFLAVLVNPVLSPNTLPEFIAGGQLRFLLVFLGMVLSVGLGALGFIPAVRQRLSHILPFNPTHFVHTIALVLVLTLTLMAFTPLVFLDEPPFLTIVTGFVAQGQQLVDRDTAGLLRDELYGLGWLLLAVLFAVGYGIRRNLVTTLKRLGLVRPTFRQILVGIGLGLLLVLLVGRLDTLINQVWIQFGWPRTNGEAFGLIINFAISPLGAVVIGLSAGLGEELAIRGVLQPRMGILLSNLFFTALHALQYNWDALIIVFTIGLVFGIIRKYSNTTTSAIAHGMYDFIIVIAIAMNVPGFE